MRTIKFIIWFIIAVVFVCLLILAFTPIFFLITIILTIVLFIYRIKTKNKKTKIIIVGPTASGKTYLRKIMENRGCVFDISYTSREPRPDEQNNINYYFISKKDFENKIKKGYFYEYTEYNGNYYGTGKKEWKKSKYFIMETEGVSKIKSKDRKNCFIIYLNPSLKVRKERMQNERGWNDLKTKERIKTDKKFDTFTDYDLMITNDNF